ncbi:prepilin peptidase [Rheinheimera sp. SA_1]|uniref:prepilin peptidase n=1 Tax=Rheinheimera sp. SA_1 TaxID=1827365 RepID=UPI000A811081|nr:A24 family peptidase [Rheinheimera sp. SA_1]
MMQDFGQSFELIVAFFQTSPLWYAVLVFIFSLCVGSFLNVVIYRLPKMMEQSWQEEYQEYFEPEKEHLKQPAFNLAVPRSRCPQCQHQLSALDNIPLLSWLVLKGRCRYCQAAIPKRYPLVELVTALVSVAVAAQTGATGLGLLYLVVTWLLVALIFIDIDKMLLPDQLTLPLLWLALVAAAAGISTVDATTAITGAAFGYLSLWSVYWLFKLLTGKEGMGFGDFKLLAVFGALLGWQQLPLIILLSSLVGAVIGTLLLTMQGKDKNNAIPFGPYIAAAGFIAMLWGEQITAAYLATLGL